ncbi:hypothetical protein HGO23_06575 [Xenorhabdus budapestensis]|uniref:Uncharacterized protein n=1 Tax=Xenorhabdus budapestensis TaxID=290110 RepID=A0ABX7VQG6_XENBU|nr:hypothetical protein [Xenorhabdus budapestensis]QTL40998.1 hypothetical protein HGO23_06575 [Xenorhabdus budapestensis]
MSEETGHVTFFEVKKLGFYPCNNSEELQGPSAEDMFNNLVTWVNSNIFENTLPVTDDNRLRKKVYCRSVYKCPQTGDYFFVFWKSEEDGNGNIQGVESDASVTESADNVIMLSSERRNGKKYIWGKPCYYWFIPKLNKFASIKFPHSSTDTYLFVRYVRDYVNFRMDYTGRKLTDIQKKNSLGKPFSYQTATFESEDGKNRVNFLFECQQFMKNAGREGVKLLKDSITHLVIRDTIGAVVSDKRAWWAKLPDCLPGYQNEKPKQRGEKQIELMIEDKPSDAQIDELFDYYDEGYSVGSNWNNIGFKLNGKHSPTKWLDEYVLRETILASYSVADKKHISASMLANIISTKRNNLLTGLVAERADDINDDEDNRITAI